MANLAIKGHATRGREVIELLEMLGGKNKFNLRGNKNEWFVLNETLIQRTDSLFAEKGFSLEEFLEKFPYKVGDKVIAYAEGCIGQFTIQDMRWNYELNKVEYKICSSWCDTSLMQPYKEETMNRKYNVEEYLKVWEETEKGLEVVVNDNFELKEDNGKFYIIKKQSQYPKTYDECLKVLGYDDRETYCIFHTGADESLFEALYRLKVCRDAYWKIAGDWKPDFTNFDEERFGIYTQGDKIVLESYGGGDVNVTLTFPTEEMLAAFFENFKDLIEQCRELL